MRVSVPLLDICGHDESSGFVFHVKHKFILFCKLNIIPFIDSQVVAHVLGPPWMGHAATGLAYNAAQAPPPDPPRCTSRNVFLHHYWLAKLAPGEDTVSN